MGIKSFLFLKIFEYNKAKRMEEEDLSQPIEILSHRKAMRQIDQFMARLRSPRKDVEFGEIVFADMKAYYAKPLEKPKRVILYLHGGGYVFGLEEFSTAYKAMTQNLAYLCKAEVYAVDYSLAPEHPFPAAIEDADRAYKQLLRNGVKPSDIFISGDSAGGGLTIALLMKLRDEGTPLPRAAIPLSPWTDMAHTGESITLREESDPMISGASLKRFSELIVKDKSVKDPYISPLYGNFRGLPPMLIMVGGREVLYDDSIRVAEKARQAGVDVTLDIIEHMIHVYPTMSDIFKEGRQALDRIAEFIEAKQSEELESVLFSNIS